MTQQQFPKFSEIAWPSTLFLCLVPVIGIFGTAFAIYQEGFSWGLLLFSLVFAGATSLSMTLGYHRLFSHRSFEAHPLVRKALIIFSTCSWQSSILNGVRTIGSTTAESIRTRILIRSTRVFGLHILAGCFLRIHLIFNWAAPICKRTPGFAFNIAFMFHWL